MTAQEYRAILTKLNLTAYRAALFLGCSPRVSQYYAAGGRRIPLRIERLLGLMQAFPDHFARFDPKSEHFDRGPNLVSDACTSGEGLRLLYGLPGAGRPAPAAPGLQSRDRLARSRSAKS